MPLLIILYCSTLFIYLLFLLTPYLVLKPTHLAEVPYPFLLGPPARWVDYLIFTSIILILRPPAGLAKSNLQLPLHQKRITKVPKSTIGVFCSPSSDSDSTHSVYFPAKDPPLELPQASKPWRVANFYHEHWTCICSRTGPLWFWSKVSQNSKTNTITCRQSPTNTTTTTTTTTDCTPHPFTQKLW